jgi:hypothetical protein
MAEDFQVGVGGVYKAVSEVGVGVGSVYKTVSEMYVGVGGAWKRFYNTITASITGTWGSTTGEPTSTLITTNTSITMVISSGTLDFTISGTGDSKETQINGGAWSAASPRTVSNGDTVKARMVTDSSIGSTTTVILNLAGYDSDTWSVST